MVIRRTLVLIAAIAGVFGVEEMGSNLANDTHAKNGGGF